VKDSDNAAPIGNRGDRMSDGSTVERLFTNM